MLAGLGKLDAARALAAGMGLRATANIADAQWRARFIAGLIAEKQGSDADAVKAYGEAMSGLEAIRSGLTSTEQRQSLADSETVTELYQRTVAALTRLGRQDEAWRTVERGKARAFAEGLQGRRFRESVPPAAAPQLAKLEQQIAEPANATGAGERTDTARPGREPAVIESELERAQPQFALARQQAGLGESRGSQAVKMEPPPLVRYAQTAAGTALVEYYCWRTASRHSW